MSSPAWAEVRKEWRQVGHVELFFSQGTKQLQPAHLSSENEREIEMIERESWGKVMTAKHWERL